MEFNSFKGFSPSWSPTGMIRDILFVATIIYTCYIVINANPQLFQSLRAASPTGMIRDILFVATEKKWFGYDLSRSFSPSWSPAGMIRDILFVAQWRKVFGAEGGTN